MDTNTINRMIKDLKSKETIIGGCTTVDEIVIALKSLKERKKGEWIWEEEWTPSTPAGPAECDYAGWVCSECGESQDEYGLGWDDPDEKPTYKYCPNCGIEMEKKRRIKHAFLTVEEKMGKKRIEMK
jgi:hypothetical protein